MNLLAPHTMTQLHDHDNNNENERNAVGDIISAIIGPHFSESMYRQQDTLDVRSVLKHTAITVYKSAISEHYEREVDVPPRSLIIHLVVPQCAKHNKIQVKRVIDDQGQIVSTTTAATATTCISVHMPIVKTKQEPHIEKASVDSPPPMESTHLLDHLKDCLGRTFDGASPSLHTQEDDAEKQDTSELALYWKKNVCRRALPHKTNKKEEDMKRNVAQGFMMRDTSMIRDLLWICRDKQHQNTLWQRCDSCSACTEWNAHK